MVTSEKKSIPRDVTVRVVGGLILLAIVGFLTWNSDLFSRFWEHLKSDAHLPWWLFWILFAFLILCLFKLFNPSFRRWRRMKNLNRSERVGNENTDLTDVFRMVDKLLFQKNDVEVALAPGRAFLLVKDYDRSLEIFKHILEIVPPTNPEYYIILGNIGYSLSGLGRHDEAIEYLLRIREYNEGKTFFVWHTMALAYAHFKIGDMSGFWKWLDESKKKPDYQDNIKWYSKLYPEIEDYLR